MTLISLYFNKLVHKHVISSFIANSPTKHPHDFFTLWIHARFAVFALGSSAYPNYCAFGKYVDTLLGDTGGERLVDLTCGDELAGQEQQFNIWAKEVFTVS